MRNQALADLVDYQTDAEESLRFYFSRFNPNFDARFAGYLAYEVTDELDERLSETDMRSVLVVMARIEAAFWTDYKQRLQRKQSDPVSIAFRKVSKKQRKKIRLDDLWDIWRQNLDNPEKALISRLRGVFGFRHWLAHGRHWQTGNKFDFQTIYVLADAVLQNIPLIE